MRLALGLSLVAFFAACFPDYQISGADNPGGADGAAGGDGSTNGPDGTTGGGDGAPGGDDGSPGGQDGSPGGDGGSGFDAAGAIVIPASGAGGYAYTSPGGGASSKVLITHDFFLDGKEATVGRFKAWVNAGKPMPCDTGQCALDPGGPHAEMLWLSSWNLKATNEGYKDPSCDRTDNSFNASPTYNGTDDNVPINCVNWYQASAFCWWDGQKRLTTQIEWQYVASGRGRGRTYPWGDTPVLTATGDDAGCALAIWRNGAQAIDNYNGCHFPRVGGSAPAGASFDGVLDMAGSVYEWTWDENWNEYPPQLPDDYSGPAVDAGVYQRISRGGGFTTDEIDVHTDRQNSYSADSTIADIGIRCAKTKL
jgi:formylglycine-generating enzyme required for sulfatase activity